MEKLIRIILEDNSIEQILSVKMVANQLKIAQEIDHYSIENKFYFKNSDF